MVNIVVACPRYPGLSLTTVHSPPMSLDSDPNVYSAFVAIGMPETI